MISFFLWIRDRKLAYMKNNTIWPKKREVHATGGIKMCPFMPEKYVFGYQSPKNLLFGTMLPRSLTRQKEVKSLL